MRSLASVRRRSGGSDQPHPQPPPLQGERALIVHGVGSTGRWVVPGQAVRTSIHRVGAPLLVGEGSNRTICPRATCTSVTRTGTIQRPYVDGVNFAIMAENVQEKAQLQAERLNVAAIVYEERDEVAKANPKAQILSSIPITFPYLYMQARQCPFKDERVRRAVSISRSRGCGTSSSAPSTATSPSRSPSSGSLRSEGDEGEPQRRKGRRGDELPSA
jgi:hypothetical protein